MVTILVLIPSKQGFTAKRHIKQVPTGTESHAKALFWKKRFFRGYTQRDPEFGNTPLAGSAERAKSTE